MPHVHCGELVLGDVVRWLLAVALSLLDGMLQESRETVIPGRRVGARRRRAGCKSRVSIAGVHQTVGSCAIAPRYPEYRESGPPCVFPVITNILAMGDHDHTYHP